jgi:DNA-binding beta-propeller fold protein YncE
VYVATDGCVFIADNGNSRVQVLSPDLHFHGVIGVGQLRDPVGVCASADVVVVSEAAADRVSVFRRSDGTLLTRFGSCGRDDGELRYPRGLCLMHRDTHVAVADCDNGRVSVFTVDGAFVRHVGVGLLMRPQGVAASAYDEIVVADGSSAGVCVFSDVGELLVTLGDGAFTGVAARGATVFATRFRVRACAVFS